MDFLAELQQRLDGLVVLTPQQASRPAQHVQGRDERGRPLEGSPSGLQFYFRDVAPKGYVQLRHGLGLLSDGLTDTGMLTVEAVAPTLPLAQALAHDVRGRVGNLPVRPTRFTFQGLDTDEQPDYARLILTFQTRSIGV